MSAELFEASADELAAVVNEREERYRAGVTDRNIGRGMRALAALERQYVDHCQHRDGACGCCAVV